MWILPRASCQKVKETCNCCSYQIQMDTSWRLTFQLSTFLKVIFIRMIANLMNRNYSMLSSILDFNITAPFHFSQSFTFVCIFTVETNCIGSRVNKDVNSCLMTLHWHLNPSAVLFPIYRAPTFVLYSNGNQVCFCVFSHPILDFSLLLSLFFWDVLTFLAQFPPCLPPRTCLESNLQSASVDLVNIQIDLFTNKLSKSEV